LACLLVVGLSLLVVTWPPRLALAAPLRQIPFSASLTTADTSLPVPDGTYAITFSLYTSASGGTPVWRETQSIAVTGGVINTNLGQSTELPTTVTFDGGSYYLGIAVGSDAEMTPRKKIGSVPSAINADTVDGLNPGSGPNSLLATDSTGSITLQGGVSVGGSIIPAASGINLGSSTHRFDALYVKNLSVDSSDLSGTASESFVINSDQTTDNAENSEVAFYLGPTLETTAALRWEASANRFAFYSRTNSSTVADVKLGNLISGSATLTLPTTSDTLVGRSTTDTLTNKTLTAPAINGLVATSGLTVSGGSVGINGTFGINTDKVTIAATTGNTAIAGTLTVTGDTSLTTLTTTGLASLHSLSLATNAAVGGTLSVAGSTTVSGDLAVGGNTTLGTNSSHAVTINGSLASSLIPASDGLYDLGSPDKKWRNFYAESAQFDSLEVANTTSANFVINSDAAVDEDSSLQFYRGTLLTPATIAWNSSLDQFEVNQAVLIHGNTTLGDASTDTTTIRGSLTLSDSSSTTALLFGTSNDAALYRSGANTIASTANLTLAPSGTATSGNPAYDSRKLTLEGSYWNGTAATTATGSVVLTIPDASIPSSPRYGLALQTANATALYVDETGNVGIGTGTTPPTGKLQVANGDLVVGTGTFNNPTSGSDAYVTGNLEVDGTIYGNITGTFVGAYNPNKTVGSVLFQDESGIAADATKLFWDNSTKRLGVGTNSPGTTVDVAGTLNASGATTFGSGLTVTGATTTNSLTVTTSATIGTTLGVTGNLSVNTNKFTVEAATGNTAIAGTLNVTGASTLSAVTVSGAASLNTLTTSGLATLQSLTVTNAATFASTLAVTGNFSVNTNKLIVDASTGNTTIAGTLGVTGATTLSSTLAVTGAATFTGNLTVDTNTLFVNAATHKVGIGTTSPTTNLSVNGGMSIKVATKTANYTATASDYAILVDATSGAKTISLPAASSVPGQVYHIKKTDASANAVTIAAYSQTTNTSSQKSPAAAQNIDDGGNDWENPTNILSSDNQRAFFAQRGGDHSNPLLASNFGFSIPANATVTSVTVEVEGYAEVHNSGQSFQISLHNNGNNLGNTYSMILPSSEAYVARGSDTWGAVLNPTIVNGSTFGVSLRDASNNGSDDWDNYVDHVRVTVYYTYTIANLIQPTGSQAAASVPLSSRYSSKTLLSDGINTWYVLENYL